MSGPVPCLMQRSELILTERQGLSTLKAVAASWTANHHYFLERPSGTLSIKEPVSNPRIRSGLCCTHREAAALGVSRSYWHGSEMTLKTAATRKPSAVSRDAGSDSISPAPLRRSPELCRCNSISPLFPLLPPLSTFSDALNCCGCETASCAGSTVSSRVGYFEHKLPKPAWTWLQASNSEQCFF